MEHLPRRNYKKLKVGIPKLLLERITPEVTKYLIEKSYPRTAI
ncbi:hypothetical protein [Thermococcus chitonophagus]|uniref:Uncharacterized protein n=1 Tax=Thermococcus chitonophagus TaxID=54262 RepID=A0A161KIR0_9EURY|nr:hypothetical protein [Thermococcus chitonophagus]CUX77698.1 hypothetical protein CHITON_0919 [Thermococcus chitonophagus]